MSPTPHTGTGPGGPVWLLPDGASQSLKGVLQHQGPDREQILTSEPSAVKA